MNVLSAAAPALGRTLWNWLYRPDPEADAQAAATRPRTRRGQLGVVALHLLPGIVAYLLLHTVRAPLEHLTGLSSAIVQMILIMTLGVMLGMLTGGTFLWARLLDGMTVRQTLRYTGVTRSDDRSLLVAVALFAVLFVLVRPLEALYREPVRAWLQAVPGLTMPAWHFQMTGSIGQLPVPWLVVALAANLVCEELYFRGYLYKKLTFLGRWTWVVAGVLFSLYHVFQAPWTYPGMLFSLAFPLLYALRRDLWACVLFHGLANAIWSPGEPPRAP